MGVTNSEKTMILAIDIGNTNIVFGIFEADDLVMSWRVSTLEERTADEFWVLLSNLLTVKKVDCAGIEGVVLASVVPALTQPISDMITNELNRPILTVNESNAGLPIRYKAPMEIGADRLVNSVAARHLYGKISRGLVVVDFGTATTFDAISADGHYQGGVICPGVNISADALFHRAARLPRVAVDKPTQLVGRTTVDAIRSGLFFGHVSMVEGIVTRIKGDVGMTSNEAAVCVATGGLANVIADEIDIIDYVNENLTLIGLKLVWERNM